MNIKKLKEMRKNKKGFTLIEIIVVVVILAVLMAVAVPSVLKYMNEADDAKYMSAARGAYISAQSELVKAFTDGDAATTTTTAYAAAADEVNKGLTNSDNTYVTSIVANGIGGDGDPSSITSYTVVFQGGKTATLTPNGSVKISDTASSNP